jgi:hypothetical protein
MAAWSGNDSCSLDSLTDLQWKQLLAVDARAKGETWSEAKACQPRVQCAM